MAEVAEVKEKEVVISPELQVCIMLYGPVGGCQEISRHINGYTKGKAKRLRLSEVVKSIVQDPGVFNLPPICFEAQNYERAFSTPIIPKEGHIRRILSRMNEKLNTQKYPNKLHKIGVSSFRYPLIETPKQLMQYVGFEVIRTSYPDFVGVISYDKFVGTPGIYVVEDLKFVNEYTLAQERFQVVLPVKIIKEKKTRKQADFFDSLQEDLSKTISFFKEVKINPEKVVDQAKALCQEVEKEVNRKMEAGELSEIMQPISYDITDAQMLPIVNRNRMQVGKCIFSDKEHVWTDDEIKY